VRHDDFRIGGIRHSCGSESGISLGISSGLCFDASYRPSYHQRLEKAMSERRKLELPDRRQHTYESLEKKIELYHEDLRKAVAWHITEIETRLVRFFARALGAFAIIGIISAVSLAGFGIVLREQKRTSEDIQRQRREVLFETCTEQNRRHDQAVEKVVKGVPTERRRAVSIAIINAGIPRADCEALTRQYVK
jgi:hypothetical protein